MKLLYDQDTDSLYIDFSGRPRAWIPSSWLTESSLDINSEGGVAGIDIDHASRRLDLNALAVVEGRPKPDGGASAAR